MYSRMQHIECDRGNSMNLVNTVSLALRCNVRFIKIIFHMMKWEIQLDWVLDQCSALPHSISSMRFPFGKSYARSMRIMPFYWLVLFISPSVIDPTKKKKQLYNINMEVFVVPIQTDGFWCSWIVCTRNGRPSGQCDRHQNIDNRHKADSPYHYQLIDVCLCVYLPIDEGKQSNFMTLALWSLTFFQLNIDSQHSINRRLKL